MVADEQPPRRSGRPRSRTSAARSTRPRWKAPPGGSASVGSRSSTRDRPADLVLVNTCTVTAEADAKSRHAVRRRATGEPGRRDRRDRLLGPGRARGVRGRGSRPRGSSTTGRRTPCSPSWTRCSGRREPTADRGRRVAPAGRAAADAVGRRGRRDRGNRRRAGIGRADPGVRQGPGRLLVLLHLLHHPDRPRPGAQPRARRSSSPTSGARSPPATARSC